MEERGNASGEKELFKLFLADIENIPLLTREEELALTRKAAAGDMESRNSLVEANLRFVIKISLECWRPGYPLMDIISEGCLGLMKAIEKFDPDLGFRLTTYAGLAIKRRIVYFIVTHREHEHTSLDEPLFIDDEDMTMQDILVSEETSADQKCFYGNIGSMLDQLSDREKDVIRQRFWHDKTLQEVGLIFNLSKDRIRTIEAKALLRLRWLIYKRYDRYEVDNDIRTDYALSR